MVKYDCVTGVKKYVAELVLPDLSLGLSTSEDEGTTLLRNVEKE